MRRCLLFLLLLPAALLSNAQEASRVDQSYVVRHFTEANGLLSNQNTLYMDRRGVLWLSSLAGLQTFDGVRFRNVTHRKGDPFTCPVNSVYNFCEPGDGQVWMGGEGLVFYNPQTEKFQTAAQRFPGLKKYPESIIQMFKDPSGDVWLQDFERWLYRYNSRTGKLTIVTEKFISADTLKKNLVFNDVAFIDQENALVVADLHYAHNRDTDGIYLFNSRTGQGSRPLPPAYRPLSALNDIWHITPDERRNCLWVTHDYGRRLVKFQPADGRMTSYSFTGELRVHVNDTAAAIALSKPVIDAAGHLWLQTTSGILIRLTADDRFEYFKSMPGEPIGFWGISEGYPRAFVPKVVDGGTEIWTTSKSGLNLLRKQAGALQFIPFPVSADYGVIGIRRIPGNRYAVLSWSDNVPQLYIFDHSFHVIRHQVLGQQGEYVTWDREESADSIYICVFRNTPDAPHYSNLMNRVKSEFMLDTRSLSVRSIRPPAARRYYYRGMPDRDGNRWYYYNDTCFRYVTATGQLDHFVVGRRDTSVIFFDFAFTVHPESNTLLVDIFPKRELLRIDLGARRLTRVFKYRKDDTTSYCADPIFGMSNYDSKHVLLKSQNDVDIINVHTGAVQHLVNLTGRVANFSTPVRKYKNQLWLFGQFDIACVIPEQNKSWKWKSGRDFFSSLSPTIDDLPPADDGELLFYGRSGIVRLNADSLLRPGRPGNIRFTSIRIDNMPLPLDSVQREGGITVKHNGYSTIEYYFSDGSFYHQPGIRYQYSLHKGNDTSWVEIEGTPELIFRNLAPGDYTVLVRASGADATFSMPTTLHMLILPPFWQTPAFIAAILAVLGVLVFVLVQRRIRIIRRQHELKLAQIREQEAEKTAHIMQVTELEMQSLRAQLNPHFMFNALNAIQQLILRNDAYKSHTYLARFAKLLRMLLEHAEKPFIPLQMELDFLDLYLSLEKLRIPDLEYSIEVSGVETADARIPNMIMQPYIENALWHGLSPSKGEKRLAIRVRREGEELVMEIVDNGIGREKAAELKALYRGTHKSRGMELLSRRFRLLSKEYGYGIESVTTDLKSNGEASGTRVTIRVPLRHHSFKSILYDKSHHN
ncbi:MAG TPA: histidine kinase [Flavisolibacter sp.]